MTAVPPATSPPVPEQEPAAEAARVRLGAGARTAPEMLLHLARDSAITVRAAVAMNQAAPADADLVLAADPDERVRALLARRLAGSLPGDGPGSGPGDGREHAQIKQEIAGVLSRLVEDEAVRVRAAVADVVKAMPDAPRELILRLARDSAVPVSDPVIRLSPILTAEDLLALVSACPAAHTVTSVARRPNLPEQVSAAVAAHADPSAIEALLSNRSAAIREATLDALVARSGPNPSWHAPLVRRPALSARAAHALSTIVATDLLDQLANRGDLPQEMLVELRQKLLDRLGAPTLPPDAEVADGKAMEAAQAADAAGMLTKDKVIAAAQRGDARQVAAMLAVAAKVDLATVDRAAKLRSAKGLVSLAWNAGFDMEAATAAQVTLGKVSPDAVLIETPDGKFPLAAEEMRWQVDALRRTDGEG